VENVPGHLQALAASHDAGLVHRDIKPANILLDHPLEEIQTVADRAVKVTDFGLGKIGGATAQSIMQSGSLLTEDGKSISGTLAYMAPEVKEGREADGRSDLYSCGIVLFEMLTGERPQGGEVPGALRPDVPGSLDAVFQKCYTRADRRYASAQEMLSDLNRQLPPAPPRAGAAPRPTGITCPSCSRPVQRDDQFCISCGRQLAQRVARCPACQGYPDPGDRYCIFCGQDLRILAE
jgi:serine/threonine-protein kinase